MFPSFLDTPDYKLDVWPGLSHCFVIKDMTNKPTRDDIQQALQDGAKPDADIDDPDEIPETTSTRKRKVQASESNDSQNSKKQKGNEDSSSSSSSSSPMDAKGAGGVPKIDKSPAEVVPKSKTAPSAKSTTAGCAS